MVLSQNANQALLNEHSYTLYDNQSRIIQTGEVALDALTGKSWAVIQGALLVNGFDLDNDDDNDQSWQETTLLHAVMSRDAESVRVVLLHFPSCALPTIIHQMASLCRGPKAADVKCLLSRWPRIPSLRLMAWRFAVANSFTSKAELQLSLPEDGLIKV